MFTHLKQRDHTFETMWWSHIKRIRQKIVLMKRASRFEGNSVCPVDTIDFMFVGSM